MVHGADVGVTDVGVPAPGLTRDGLTRDGVTPDDVAPDVEVHAADPGELVVDAREMVARVVGNDRSVLALGAQVHGLFGVLQRRGCRITAARGTEHTEVSAAADRVVVVDLVGPGALVSPDGHVDGEYDVVLIGDVLGAVDDPRRLVADATALLAERGRVVVSVANSRHADRRLALLYGDPGSAPERSFDLEALLELLRDSALSPVAIDRTTAPVFGTAGLPAPGDVPGAVLDAVVRVAESDTVRFAISAEPADRVLDPEAIVTMVQEERTAARLRAAAAADALLRRESADPGDTLESLQDRLIGLQQELGVARSELVAAVTAESGLRGVQERLEHLMNYQRGITHAVGGVDGEALHDVVLARIGSLQDDVHHAVDEVSGRLPELLDRLDGLETGLGAQVERAEQLRLMIEQQGQTLAALTGRIDGVEGRSAPLYRRVAARMRRRTD